MRVLLSQIARLSLVEPPQERELGEQIQGADDPAVVLAARHRLTLANLRLVVSIARRYSGRGVPMLDLIQEGAIGVLAATAKFDPSQGYRFGTYASWWIRQAMTNAVMNQGRVIPLPASEVEILSKLARAHRELREASEAEPTIEEVLAKAEVSPATYEATMALPRTAVPLGLLLPEHGVLNTTAPSHK